jgi:hypothetical protein
MGIRFRCPSGHKLHVKAFLAGKRGVCPHCGARFVIPATEEAEPAGGATQQNAYTSTGIVAPSSVGSPSIIITVADERVAASPSNGESSEIRLAEDFLPPAAAQPQPATSSIPIGAVDLAPAAWHVSRRKRERRKQFHMAIALLVTVILLALVLIWVLQHSVSAASADAQANALQRPTRSSNPAFRLS